MDKKWTLTFVALVGVALGICLAQFGPDSAVAAIKSISYQYDDTNVVFIRLEQTRAPTGGAIRLRGCAVVPKLDGGFVGSNVPCVDCGTVVGSSTVTQMRDQCLPIFQTANDL